MSGGGEGEAVAELIMKQFQVVLYKRSSPWGVGKGGAVKIVGFRETIARLPGGLSEQIAIKGRSSW